MKNPILVKRSAAFFFAGLCAVLLPSGCKPPGATQAREPALRPVPVHVEVVRAKKRVETEECVGTVRSKTRAVIEAKVSGRIARMPIVLGQSVKAGQMLAGLEVQENRARLDQAIAVQEQATNDLRRFQALLERGAATQAEFDAVQARARVAGGAVKEAQTMLDYADVVAPFDGVVTRKLADVGDLATPGKPLLEMEDSVHLRLETDIPEAIVGAVKLNGRLKVHIANLPGELQATVSEIAPAADPGSRTFHVKLDLPNIAGLRAGQFGRVSVPVGETTALRVPFSAVLQRGELQLVFVVEKKHAGLRLVKAGRQAGNEVEIASGLVAGERIVTDPPATMVDGQPVEIQP